MMFCMLLDLV